MKDIPEAYDRIVDVVNALNKDGYSAEILMVILQSVLGQLIVRLPKECHGKVSDIVCDNLIAQIALMENGK